MEQTPGFIGTAGVPLVRQANISLLAEFTPHPEIIIIKQTLGVGLFSPRLLHSARMRRGSNKKAF